MEYQHAAVDQYARNVSPNIQEFVGYSPDKQPDVAMEYSQVAFRFGHSTLRETIDTMDPTGGITGKIMGYALHDAFLNPEAFGSVGPGSILLGMTHQQMNEVDEFVTPALNQGLLGQPLDLAAINIARGRDVGMPTLNDFREAIGLLRYTSWTDFGQNMQHPASLVNFIAAYAFDGNVDKAQAVIDLGSGGFADAAAGAVLGTILGWTGTVAELEAKAIAFLSGDATVGGEGTLGFNQIDTWLGGLAEVHQPGGILGETFDAVFVTQIESLMDGDRFYYLYRLAGQQFGEEVANGQLKDLVERNSGLTHLNGNIFGYADQYVDLGAHKEIVATGAEALTTGNEHKYGDIAAVAAGTMGVYSNGGLGNAHDGQIITIGGKDYIQDTRLSADNPMSAQYDPTGQSAYAQNDFVNLDGTPNSGAESNEVIVGSKGDDLIYAQGGDDTAYGDDGNDIIYGGYGIDRLYGGAGADIFYGGDNPDLIDGGSGDDIIYGESSGTDINGSDQLIGGSGNDTIYGGTGIDKLSAGSGDDVIYGGQDTDPFTHGGDGNDYVSGDSGGDILYGDNGDDIVVGGADQDQLFGNDGDDILRPGDPTGALTIGSDEVLGGDGVDVNDKGFDLIDFSDNTARPGGVSFDIGNQANPNVTVNGSPIQVPSFQIDGVVGSVSDDTLIGDDESAAGSGSDISIAGDNWLIGGSGNDMFQGLGGNDIIVGGSIRLDALIGKYSSGYTHNNANGGLTEADQLLDAQYQGASHRVAYNEVIDNSGLLGHTQTAMFDKHFTEMLRTEMFKNTVLGDGDGATLNIDGGARTADAGTQDTAIYTGNFNLDNPNQSDYTFVALNAQGGVVANPHVDGFFALKITDHRTANDFIDANGNPLVDANGNPLTNEGTDLIIGVENLQFANGTIKTAALFDKAPNVDLNYLPVADVTTRASDSFSGGGNAYGHGNGWSGNWTETNDNNSSSSGQISAGSSNSQGISGTGLHFTGGFGNNYNGAEIYRGINLSGVTGATLSFDVREFNLGAGETVKVYLSPNGVAPAPGAPALYTIDGATGSTTQTVSVALPAGAGIGARLYFVASAMSSGNDNVWIDNITVGTPSGTFHDGAPGNNWSTGYTEAGAAAAVAAAGKSLVTDADDTLLQSATIHIREGVAGDVLAVGTLPATISAVVSADHRTVTLTSVAAAGAAKTAFEDAIEAVTFSNSGLNPTNYGQNQSRHLDVTVSDGLRDSAVATTTVAITAIDSPTVLGSDSVITNVGTNTNFSISDAALLANDSDPDTILSISGIGNGNGISTSGQGRGHSNGTVTVSDTFGGANTFTYTVNGSSATVTVTQQGGNTLTGTGGGEIIIGNSSANTVNAGGGNDWIDAGGGSDIVNAGDGDDTIVYNVTTSGFNGNTLTSGRDIIDGGANGAVGDRVIINGTNGSETFRIFSNTDGVNGGPSSAARAGITGMASGTKIVITRGGSLSALGALTGTYQVLVELKNVEEITINTLDATAQNGDGVVNGGTSNGDTVAVIGDFTATGLAYSTITVNGGKGDDVVDISGLTSDHRIVFNGGDGSNTVVGNLREQDVLNHAAYAEGSGTPEHAQTGGDTGPAAGTGDDATDGDTTATDDTPATTDTPVVDTAPPTDTPPTDTPPTDTPPTDTPATDTPATDTPATDTATTDHNGLTLTGDDSANTLIGGDANDLIFGGDGADNIIGGGGSDMLFGDGGNDRIFGSDGGDVIDAGDGNDVVFAGDGNDLIIAGQDDGRDTYWGGEGVDTIDYGAVAQDVQVDLGSGMFGHGSVTVGGVTDTIYGFENVVTGSGNDMITANSLANVMDGGAGNDTFIFTSAGAADGDTILGFAPGDKIDLSGIDADQGTAGHQSFVLFATGGFSAAGQLSVTFEDRADGAHTIVQGNVNGDDAADFTIDLAGHHNLTASDFSGVN